MAAIGDAAWANIAAMADTCPACGAARKNLEPFCVSCGQKLGLTEHEQHAQRSAGEAAARLEKARKWLLAVAILTLLSGVVMYFVSSSETEKQIAQFQQQVGNMPAAERDQLLKERVGMTYDEILAHDRGQVTLLLAVNLGLALAYLGLWWWAKRNGVMATIVALLLFVTVHAINAFLDPKTLAQGVILKVALIAALVSALRAALEARRAAAEVGPAAVPPSAAA